jgi:hypothetical protein
VVGGRFRQACPSCATGNHSSRGRQVSSSRSSTGQGRSLLEQVARAACGIEPVGARMPDLYDMNKHLMTPYARWT